MANNNGQPAATPHAGLSPAALKLAYRLQGLKDHVEYGIILVKLDDGTWLYKIEPTKAKVECAR